MTIWNPKTVKVRGICPICKESYERAVPYVNAKQVRLCGKQDCKKEQLKINSRKQVLRKKTNVAKLEC